MVGTLTPAYPDVVPEISKWLTEIHEEISSFWIGAEWDKWARYEIYMILDKAFGSTCLVTHGSELWNDSDEEVDILLEPRDEALKPIAIKLRCERVSENCGSFETFCELYNDDMEKVKQHGVVQGGYEGAKLLLVGFSGQPMDDPDGESQFKMKPEPVHFSAGDVHGWVAECELKIEESGTTTGGGGGGGSAS